MAQPSALCRMLARDRFDGETSRPMAHNEGLSCTISGQDHRCFLAQLQAVPGPALGPPDIVA
ncbi:hypothetical protein AJ88_43315 [Mesorhizobium amorphae CCBAU 01583]|nr:hypothetical protein AJ88_43315 [Mesorhizobium amorphae CCBAU 01583]